MSWNYDPELPAGFQDADFEMRELEEAANRAARLRDQGICVHDRFRTFDTGEARCGDCGVTFLSEEALLRDRAEKLA